MIYFLGFLAYDEEGEKHKTLVGRFSIKPIFQNFKNQFYPKLAIRYLRQLLRGLRR